MSSNSILELSRLSAGSNVRCTHPGWHLQKKLAQDHTRYIPSVVFELVSRSKMVILVTDGLSPNAFYEAGFADAMKKEVVIVARERADLPFDVAQRHAIVYGASERRLELELKRKLIALRLEPPVGL